MEVSTIIAAIIFLSLLICCTIGLLLYVLGIFTSVVIGAGPPPIGEAVVAYKFGKGPYKNSGQLFNEACSISPLSKSIGIYYDDPNKIPQEKLRYAVGVILSEGGVKVEKELQDQMTSHGFKVMHLPAVTNCVKTTFPFVNTLSIFIAIWKVYPKLGAYIYDRKLCAYPVMEIYTSDAIHFMAPLAKQEDFFVEEALECVPEEYATGEGYTLDLTDGNDDESYASSCSRSASSFSYSSRLLDTFEESDSEDGKKSPEIQDGEVSSSVFNDTDGHKVSASKAQTDLLADESPADISTASMTSAVAGVEESVMKDNSSLQDSGICSGRASVDAVDLSKDKSDSVAETASGADGNESSSSFEEIPMDATANTPTS